MSRMRVVANVAGLPTTTFGHRSMMWWGTLAFIIIEGSTLFICGVSYVYLRKNFPTWPPERVFRPALTAAAVQAGLMLISNVPMAMVDRASRRLNLATVRSLMLIC
jgi:heme/copper-type cytochrome/quinol oxidase subunit 3